MPEPNVRLDRIALTEQQLRTAEVVLYAMADTIDRLTAAGAAYTQVMLSPEEVALKQQAEAAAKRAAMNGGLNATQ